MLRYAEVITWRFRRCGARERSQHRAFGEIRQRRLCDFKRDSKLQLDVKARAAAGVLQL